MSGRSRTPTPQLNQKIFHFLNKVQGLGKTNIHHDLRQHFISLKEKSIRGIYEYEKDPDSLPRRRLKIKPLEKFIPLPPDYKTGKLKPIKPIKSSDDTSLIFYSKNGKLVVPNDIYSRANNGYLSQDKVIKHLNLQATHEINDVMKKLADRLYPKPKFKLKKRIKQKVVSEVVKERLYNTLKPISLTPNNICNKKFDVLFEQDGSLNMIISSRELLSPNNRIKRSKIMKS